MSNDVLKTVCYIVKYMTVGRGCPIRSIGDCVKVFGHVSVLSVIVPLVLYAYTKGDSQFSTIGATKFGIALYSIGIFCAAYFGTLFEKRIQISASILWTLLLVVIGFLTTGLLVADTDAIGNHYHYAVSFNLWSLLLLSCSIKDGVGLSVFIEQKAIEIEEARS